MRRPYLERKSRSEERGKGRYEHKLAENSTPLSAPESSATNLIRRIRSFRWSHSQAHRLGCPLPAPCPAHALVCVLDYSCSSHYPAAPGTTRGGRRRAAQETPRVSACIDDERPSVHTPEKPRAGKLAQSSVALGSSRSDQPAHSLRPGDVDNTDEGEIQRLRGTCKSRRALLVDTDYWSALFLSRLCKYFQVKDARCQCTNW